MSSGVLAQTVGGLLLILLGAAAALLTSHATKTSTRAAAAATAAAVALAFGHFTLAVVFRPPVPRSDAPCPGALSPDDLYATPDAARQHDEL